MTTQIEKHPLLEDVSKPSLSTQEIAYYTGMAPQTWRKHACYETGPIRPVRLLGRLRWSTSQVRALLGVA